jgi:hypothetical protein
VRLSTLLTAGLSIQRVTADSKAAQVQARLLVAVKEAEVPVEPQRVGVPAVVEAGDSMVEEGVNKLLINGGKNSV